MTQFQKTCLETIRKLTRDGVSPSFGEIGVAMGIGRSHVHRLVHGLRDCGALRMKPGKWRSIEIVDGLDHELERLVAAHGLAAVRDGLDAMDGQAA